MMMCGSVWSTLVKMFLFTLSSLLAFSQAMQSNSDWCLNETELDGMMMCSCIAGSMLEQKAKDAQQQCSYLAESGSGSGSGFGSGMPAMRQTSDDQCPPVSEMGIAVNDPNPMYPEDSMTDCVLGAMDFLAPGGHPRNKQIRKALDSITSPSFMEFFSYGNNTKERWDNCRNGHGLKNYMMERATKCGDAYTEDEAKAMKFYGARWDAYQCLTMGLHVPCQEAIFEDNMGCKTPMHL